MPPLVLVVMGVAGAGKTTVGQAIAARLGWPFHDADDFHSAESVARMRAGLGLTDELRAPWLARLEALAAGALARGESMVLACSALRRRYRDALVPEGAPPGALRFAYLRVSPRQLAHRLATRAGHFAPPALLESQLATIEEPVAESWVLVLDGEQAVEALVEVVTGWLDAAR